MTTTAPASGNQDMFGRLRRPPARDPLGFRDILRRPMPGTSSIGTPTPPVTTRPSSRAPTARVSWIVPAAGAAWAAWTLRHSYFFYDEWDMVERALRQPAWDGMLASFNGHLWMLQYWIYRLQVRAFGVDDHVFVSAVFVLALVALHASVAWLLRVSGLSATSATLLGGLLTYLGAASQNFAFAIQLSPALSLAAAVSATAIVVGGHPSPRRVGTVAALLLAAVAIDSGTALGGLTLAAVATIGAWRGPARLAIVPAVVVLTAWIALTPHGPTSAAGIDVQLRFATRLLLYATGALVGGGVLAGIEVTVVAAGLVWLTRRQVRIDARSRIMLAAGTAAALVMVAALTYARADIGGDFIAFNRYLQHVALPLTLAFAPIVAAAAVGATRRLRPRATPALTTGLAAALIALAFLAGLAPRRLYLEHFLRYNAEVRRGVASAAVVLRDGCPSGLAPDAGSLPVGAASPQVSTALVRDLLDRGHLSYPASASAEPAVVARICR
jgi:hypothetical protein